MCYCSKDHLNTSELFLVDSKTGNFLEDFEDGKFRHNPVKICHIDLEIGLVFSKDLTTSSMLADKLCQKATWDWEFFLYPYLVTVRVFYVSVVVFVKLILYAAYKL